MCPVKVRSAAPEGSSHCRSVQSSESEITVLPSGPRAQLFTAALCSVSVLSSRPLATSQIRTV